MIMERGFRLAATLALTLAAGCATARTRPVQDPAARIATVFERLRDDPLRLRAFLAAMPKGGDLHNHLDGAIYAETFLTTAEAGGLCIDIAELAIRQPPCSGHDPRADQALRDQPGLENTMIDALSMRDFVPRPGDQSGHDHFFATFVKFDAAAEDPAPLLVEEARRAASEHIDYLELIWMRRRRDAVKLGMAADWHGEDFAHDLAPIAVAMDTLARQSRRDVDAIEARMHDALGCSTRAPDPACNIVIRYQSFSIRTLSPQAVFAQIAFDFALAAADPRFIGVNIVAPEDDPVALRDYALHMRMLRFFHRLHPEVKLSLHAGELAFGLVPPTALKFHIRAAVEIAGASRIGHGVSVMYEDDAAGLLAEMAQRKVAVEINQTSNAQILGVQGAQHPFQTYRAAGVPVVISTDDEGVERTDLTQEYLRAVQTWHLSYRDLKTLSRASVLYSFLPGAPLPIVGDGEPLRANAKQMASSEKARLQWRLESEFAAFEKTMLEQKF